MSKPVCTRYYLPGLAARTISALLTFRDHLIAPSRAASKSAGHTESQPG